MDNVRSIVKKLRENRILNEREDYNKLDVKELIKRAQDGDQLAVETLINTHQDFIGRMSSKYVLDSGDRDDVRQVATIAFWDAIMNYNFNGEFEPYAGMIMKRKLTDELRKDTTGKAQINNQAANLDAPVNSDDEGGEATLGSTLASSDLSAEDLAIGRQEYKELMNYIQTKLSDTERKAIMMYIKGYKVADIAEETGMKYKSIENALGRVKGKIADYLRTRESKKIRESKGVEFSEEEIQILESIFTQITEQESLREAASAKYEQYTEEQFDEELDEIEAAIREIEKGIEEVYYDDRDDMINELDDLKRTLLHMEDYLTDEQYERSEELKGEIRKVGEKEYTGKPVHRDPLRDVGMSQKDFV